MDRSSGEGRLAGETESADGAVELVSRSRDLGSVSVSSILDGNADSRIQWADPDGLELVGRGVAVRFTADGTDRFDRIRSQASRAFDRLTHDGPAAARPRAIGGFRFTTATSRPPLGRLRRGLVRRSAGPRDPHRRQDVVDGRRKPSERGREPPRALARPPDDAVDDGSERFATRRRRNAAHYLAGGVDRSGRNRSRTNRCGTARESRPRAGPFGRPRGADRRSRDARAAGTPVPQLLSISGRSRCRRYVLRCTAGATRFETRRPRRDRSAGRLGSPR